MANLDLLSKIAGRLSKRPKKRNVNLRRKRKGTKACEPSGGNLVRVFYTVRIDDLIGNIQGRQYKIPKRGKAKDANDFIMRLQSWLDSTVKPINLEYDWGDEELRAIEDRITERIFMRGFNSADLPMRPAKSKERVPKGCYSPLAFGVYKYRYMTGRLARSIRVVQINSKGDLRVSFSREDDVLESLKEKFGEFLAPSPSDLAYIQWLYLIGQGFILKDAPEPEFGSRFEFFEQKDLLEIQNDIQDDPDLPF